MDFDSFQMEAQGRLADCRNSVDQIAALTDAAPHWLPGNSLKARCRTALAQIDRMEERLGRKLVVTLVGPTGSGKSTLINALSGDDRLSLMGIQRPTTREIVVFGQDHHDVDLLRATIDAEKIAFQTGSAGRKLAHVLLVDTPDMDSTESASHLDLLEKIIALSDVLICVLNAENPKRKDTIDFFRPYVALYPGSLLYVVLNRCDRLPEEELKTLILPDVRQHLQAAWRKPIAHIFCISARRHLQNPAWSPDEQPLHHFDQFKDVEEIVFSGLNQGNVLLDARVGRAEHLADLVRQSAARAVNEVADALRAAQEEIQSLDQQAQSAAVEAWQQAGNEGAFGIQAAFYQQLAQRWWGPVGWAVAIWARFLLTGAGIVGAMRIGNPILQLWGVVSAVVRYRKSKEAVDAAVSGKDTSAAATQYRLTWQQGWVEIADKLIGLGFIPAVRRLDSVVTEDNLFSEQLTAGWKSTLESVMEKRASAVSGFLLQLLFNLPTLALLALFAYQSVDGFLRHQTPDPGYFLHAVISILLVWTLSFVILQILIRFAGGKKLVRLAFVRLTNQVRQQRTFRSQNTLAAEIEAILTLSQAARNG